MSHYERAFGVPPPASQVAAESMGGQARVLLLSLDGEVLQQLDAPKGGEFNFDEANGYYSKNPRKGCPWHEVQGLSGGPDFAVTDVTYCPENGRLYCVTGYCDGDFVLSASMGDDDGRWAWGPVAWGGKGDGAAQFQIAHGVFAHEGHIFVANREAHQVLEFTPGGQLVRMRGDIPAGARICNVARAGEHGYFVMNALAPLGDGLTGDAWGEGWGLGAAVERGPQLWVSLYMPLPTVTRAQPPMPLLL